MTKSKSLMPFSLVSGVDVDGMSWLEALRERIALFKEMRPTADRKTTEALTKAEACARLALRAMRTGEAESVARCAMCALHYAWQAELRVGGIPQIKSAKQTQKQRVNASGAASREAEERTTKKQQLVDELLKEVSPTIRKQGKAATSRKIKELAAKATPTNADFNDIAELCDRQIRNIAFRK